MSSVQCLRGLITERLTAAAEQILRVYGKPVVEYEEEIDRQRRLLDIVWKHKRKLLGTQLPQQHVCKEEEVLPEQQFCDQERNSSLDQEEPEPPQMKEEQEEPVSSQEGEQLVLKQETDTSILTPTHGESEHSEPEPNSDQQLLSHNSSVAERQYQRGSEHVEPGSPRNEEPKRKKMCHNNTSHSDNVENSPPTKSHCNTHTEFVNNQLTIAAEQIFMFFEKTFVQYEEEINRQSRLLDIALKPEIKLHRTELPQQHVCKEEEVLPEQQFCDQERNSSLDQEEPEPPQMKEEQEEPVSSQEGEQLVLKQETDTSILTPTHGESEHSEPEPNSDQQLLSHNSPVAERQDQRGSEHVETGSTRNEEPKRKKKCHNSTSDHVENSPPTKSHRNTCTGEKLYPCKDCGRAFGFHSTLKVHMRTHTGERPYSCETCGKCFSQRSSLNTHMRVHTDEKPYACETCGKCFKRSQELNAHKIVHTGMKPYSCETCGKCFKRREKLNAHKIVHTDEKPYSCETCGKCFKRREALNAHKIVHTDEKPYSCETCGKCFKRREKLNAHKIVHTGVKPYSCETCGKSFKRRDDLNFHMRVHTARKPYSCKTCGKCFSQRSSLNTHMRVHTDEKPYSCETCGKCFKWREALNVHMRVHTDEKPYSCETCGKCFSQRSNLNAHMRVHHGANCEAEK